MSWKEPIHVLGAGSIGLLWTASIRSKFPNYPITLLLRDHERNRQKVETSTNQRQRHHLSVSWNNRLFNRQETVSLPVQFIRSEPQPRQESIQTLIVATKAHQAKQAVESVLDRLALPDNNDNEETSPSDTATEPFHHRKTQIVVLCNGALSVKEELSKLPLPTHTDLVLATTTHGAYITDQDEQRLVHAGVGTTFVQDASLADLWEACGLHCSVRSQREMEFVLWNKLAANCVINPLTCIYKCTNGELLMEPSFYELQDELLREVESVARGTFDSTQVPTLEEMRQFVSQTIRDTADNKSSMYQDVHTKHHRTEIDHLNQYVVRKGRELGTECPSNEDLCLRIAQLSAQNSNNKR